VAPTRIDGVVEAIHDGLSACAAQDEYLGLSWSVTIGDDERSTGALGWIDRDGGRRSGVDTIYRISSMTKPVTAAAALVLVDRGLLQLTDAVDAWLPELSERRVLRHRAAPLDDTVAADRPITVEDLLSFRFGLGMDFSDWSPTPIAEALAGLEINAGPPQPALPPELDEWLRRLGTLPLQYQPGDRWLYDLSADVLGALIARVTGRPFDQALCELVLDPLGMVDTGFSVPEQDLDRFGACWSVDDSGDTVVFDPADGQWSAPPAFPAGSAGLVSTVDDVVRFATALRHGGELDGTRLLSPELVEDMTTDRLTPAQRAAGPSFDGRCGWGLGIGVQVEAGDGLPAGAYGWDGGLGSVWRTDPATDVTVVLLTNRSWLSPEPPPVRDVVIGAFDAVAEG
jgi:CubicO group peptidase (beta-lactamase class C family)